MRWKYMVLAGASFLVGCSAYAFSLLGPYADWMDQLKGYRQAGDIGGPVNINEGYRWNVPVITYGFDESFLVTFGDDGVTAVEDAIQVYNDLPAASQIELTNFPPLVLAQNPAASAYNLVDLKSVTMSALTEQLGLADPVRYVYTLRNIEIKAEETNFTFIQRNFDPESFTSSPWINDVQYVVDGCFVRTNPFSYFPNISQVTLEPNAYAVAQQSLPGAGFYFTGLTRDDVGGLRYLLRRQNTNVETLLPGTEGVGTNTSNFVVTALRPGVDKVMFVRQVFDTGSHSFVPFTNDFVDTFITNGTPQQQTLRRIVTEPDIIFSARDLGVRAYTGMYTQGPRSGRKYRFYEIAKNFERTDTSRWIDNSALNGTGGPGPGVIVPGVRITFHDAWKYALAAGASGYDAIDAEIDTGDEIVSYTGPRNWASYTNSANIVLHRSAATNLSHLTLEARVTATNTFYWALLANKDAVYDIQRSTNFVTWDTVQTFTNSNQIYVFVDTNFVEHAFYRAVKIATAPFQDQR